MDKHTQTIRVFDHFVGLAVRGLYSVFIVVRNLFQADVFIRNTAQKN